jgi:hypothetical protein
MNKLFPNVFLKETFERESEREREREEEKKVG